MANEEFPEKGDLVIGEVRDIKDYGAFIELLEYQDKTGLVHISEISNSWVKNIRNHVKNGQRMVAKVVDVDEEKDHINLSLKRVSGESKRRKLEANKRSKRAEGLLKHVAREIGEDESDIWSVWDDLEEEFGDVYEGFIEVAKKGEDALEGVVPEKWVDTLYENIKKNIDLPSVEIASDLQLECYEGDGVRIIREALKEGEEASSDEETDLEVRYQGAPNYRISVKAPDYKKAERTLDNFYEAVESYMDSYSGSISIERD